MTKYKVYISIDGKESLVVIENGKVNINPTKYDIKEAKSVYYSRTNICPRCRDENNITHRSILCPKNALHERDNNGEMTNEYVCYRHGLRHYERYNPNSMHNTLKSIANFRTGNQHPDHNSTKGDKDLDLVCELYGYEDLNKKYDDYEYPIDCYDPKTGLYHQVQGRILTTFKYILSDGKCAYYEGWPFTNFYKELNKEFDDMICVCKNDHGNIIEEIYRIPFEELKRGAAKILKNRLRNSTTLYWYDKYRITNKEELKDANDILKKMIR
jgi:hypothetical protein